MAAPKFLRAGFQLLDHRSLKFFGHNPRQERENQVHLAAGSIKPIVIQGFLDPLAEGFVPGAEFRRIGLLPQHARDFLQFQIHLAQRAVGHQVDRSRILHVHPNPRAP